MKFKLFALFLASSLLIACGGEKKENPDISSEIEEGIADEELQIDLEEEEAEEEVFLLPSPLQIGSIFKNAGLKYQSGVVAPRDQTASFSTTDHKALALGVYFADMTYCVLNSQTQEAKEYLSQIKTLTDAIGLSAVFEGTTLLQRFENNLGNQDSLLTLLIDVQDRVDMHIHENSQDELEAIIFAGGWVEGMHLGANSPKEEGNSVDARIAEQMTILENVVGLLKDTDRSSDKLNNVVSSLDDLYKYYDQIEIEDNQGKRGYRIADEHVSEIAKKVETIRGTILSI
jgi:hypothetical protein